MRRDTKPCALAIGGLDPGGGAGIAADLRAFDAAGAFGCAVASIVTVQSTAGLRSVHPVQARLVTAQAREVLLHQDVRAAKVGALGSPLTCGPSPASSSGRRRGGFRWWSIRR